MFPPNPLINLLLLSCLTKAQSHHPVSVSHFNVEATHIHMLLYVSNPDDVKGFMERFKTESAHAVNRLLGRRKRTIWCEGYDSPVVLDLAAAVRRVVYIYENPAKDFLVDSIDLYPGLSSWKHFRAGVTKFKSYLIPRNYIRALPVGPVPQQLYKNEARLLKHDKLEATFRIEPNAWMKAFGITEKQEQEQINELIVSLLKEREQQYREERAKEGRSVIGAHRLALQKPGTPYTPDRKGKRTICVAEDGELRRRFIAAMKGIFAEAKSVLAEWRRGRFLPYPLGVYAPSWPKVAEPFGAVGFVLG